MHIIRIWHDSHSSAKLGFPVCVNLSILLSFLFVAHTLFIYFYQPPHILFSLRNYKKLLFLHGTLFLKCPANNKLISFWILQYCIFASFSSFGNYLRIFIPITAMITRICSLRNMEGEKMKEPKDWQKWSNKCSCLLLIKLKNDHKKSQGTNLSFCHA